MIKNLTFQLFGLYRAQNASKQFKFSWLLRDSVVSWYGRPKACRQKVNIFHPQLPNVLCHINAILTKFGRGVVLPKTISGAKFNVDRGGNLGYVEGRVIPPVFSQRSKIVITCCAAYAMLHMTGAMQLCLNARLLEEWEYSVTCGQQAWFICPKIIMNIHSIQRMLRRIWFRDCVNEARL